MPLPRHSGITFEGKPHLTLGGVGRNLAQALEFLGHKPLFISSFARDNLAQFARTQLAIHFPPERLSIAEHFTQISDHELPSSSLDPSSSYSSCFALVLMDSQAGLCEFVVANLDAMKAINVKHLERNASQIKNSALLVMDANLPSNSIDFLMHFCATHRVPIFLEPTDVSALPRLISSLAKAQNLPLLCMSPNLIELIEMLHLFDRRLQPLESNRDEKQDRDRSAIYQQRQVDDDDDAAAGDYSSSLEWTLERVERAAERLMRVHLPQLRCLLVTLDKRGALLALRSRPSEQQQSIEQVTLLGANPRCLPGWQLEQQQQQQPSDSHIIRFRHFPSPNQIEAPLSASGAGDSFAAGFISGLLKGNTLNDCMELAFKAANLSLHSEQTIPETLRDLS